MAWIEQRMAFSAERVRPGLNLPLPVTPFSSAANLPTATEQLLQNHPVATLSSAATALWCFALCKTRETRTGGRCRPV